MCAAAQRRGVTAAVGGLGLLLAGCSAISLDDRAGLSCIDDTPYCVAQREKTLKSMLADKTHKWVREAPTAQAHATGVRLAEIPATAERVLGALKARART